MTLQNERGDREKDSDEKSKQEKSDSRQACREIAFSRGFGKYDNSPDQCSAADATAFLAAICADRGIKKGQQWISAPCADAPVDALHLERFSKSIGAPHRCSACVLPCSWLAFDIDKGMTPGAFQKLRQYLRSQNVLGLVYTTASHSTEHPRCRIILMLDRHMARRERIRASVAMRARCDEALRAAGCEPVTWDSMLSSIQN